MFGKRRFAAVIDDSVVRGELHAIADSLRLLEGYLSLQDIELFPYTKFVKAICGAHKNPSFPVAFALAEAHFKIGDSAEARTAFEKADRKLGDESGEHQENRKKATLKEASLICHSRLRFLKSQKGEPDDETRYVTRAAHDAREATDKLRQGRVTIFSELQRRNISQKDFRKEISLIVEQDPYSDENSPG